MGELRALLLRALFFHEPQNFPCFPKGYKPKPCLELLHILICPLTSHTDFHSFWNVHLWVSESPFFRSSSLLQDLGGALLSLHVAFLKPEKLALVLPVTTKPNKQRWGLNLHGCFMQMVGDLRRWWVCSNTILNPILNQLFTTRRKV